MSPPRSSDIVGKLARVAGADVLRFVGDHHAAVLLAPLQ